VAGRTLRFRGATYRILTVDLTRADLRILWKDAKGRQLRTLEAVKREVEAGGKTLLAATNAGIFEPGEIPTGVLIQDGTTHVALNLKSGSGNFFMKPNGVFALGPRGAAVLDATQFPAASIGVRQATQSGPLLVLGGKFHPQLGPTSRKLRSGIGVRGPTEVVLAISEGDVSFRDFGALFRDALHCPDALYLDGTLSRLYAPALGLEDLDGGPFAGVIAVTSR
jgi:uncharacterized protein YigE (DUF2233 family)